MLSPYTVLRLISYWPPYLLSGIKVVSVNRQLDSIVVRLRRYPWNQNYFGTHFGGSLYSMCDPFFVFILAEKLGRDYIIWDIGAKIEFIKATKEPVFASFHISPRDVEYIAQQSLEQFSVQPDFFVDIKTKDGTVIAKVAKKLYVRRKDAKERFGRSEDPAS